MTFLAHSRDREHGIPAQEYAEHVSHVIDGAADRADDAGRYSTHFGDILRPAVRLAAEFHDLGKLDPVNQQVLCNDRGKMLNHVDAGVAHLFDGLPERAQQMAGIAVYAHHIGLPALAEENAKGAGNAFRDDGAIEAGIPLSSHTNTCLPEYRRCHQQVVPARPSITVGPNTQLATPLFMRVALSCLVDADHSDTARHYGDPVAARSELLTAKMRLRRLDQYVETLSRQRDDDRSRLRSSIYRECREASDFGGMVACDSPVGTGKTTAVMAHLLQVAAKRALRRIFVVLPFTNIIDQSVDVYRKALVSTEEHPESIVAAHHHRTEFTDLASRQYSFLWHAPVVVTTAVRFFETLAARKPAALRNLHQIPGSAIFIDEAHTALPVHLWPQAWKWLDELRQQWGCHVVFGSGSLNCFWELQEFVKPTTTLPQIVQQSLREASATFEKRRVEYREHPVPLDLKGLAEFVWKLEGPRLLIVNTVQSAAAIARCFGNIFGKDQIEHLSTALTSADRAATLSRVKSRLKNRRDENWALVATACVEAGVDLSFRSGIRERCSLTSLLQTAGRINRSNEFNEAIVWDIRLKHDHLLRPHPAFEESGRILGELFAEGKVSPDFCTESLRREVRQRTMLAVKEEILRAERNGDFPTVEETFRVISADTVTVIVDKRVIKRLEQHEYVSRDEIQSGSVQIWQSKSEQWGVEEIVNLPELKKWLLAYDRFLGYMAGVLPLIDGGHSGFVL